MKKKGQGILEYAILLAVVLAAFSSMSIYIQRATQANARLLQERAFPEVEYGNVFKSWVEAFDLWEMIGALF